MGEIAGLIREFSEPGFTHALGHHGEMLADIGFADIGFRVLSSSVGWKNWQRCLGKMALRHHARS
jgi:hypothetical protein